MAATVERSPSFTISISFVGVSIPLIVAYASRTRRKFSKVSVGSPRKTSMGSFSRKSIVASTEAVLQVKSDGETVAEPSVNSRPLRVGV
ncbi:hypothetical protein ES703_92823 [subsurface metagenome]